MQIRKVRLMVGMHALNLLWLFQTPAILLYTLSAVSAVQRVLWAFTNCLYADANHRFIAEECDWGFTRFSELRKLFNIQENHSRPTIEEDSANVTVFVKVLKDPTGVLWHNFVKYVGSLPFATLCSPLVSYDSKKETGYVGLKNQGATCYMNSLLQSLFCTRYFRRVRSLWHFWLLLS